MKCNSVLATVTALAAAVLFAGCDQRSPEEKIAEARTRYVLEPTGMLVQEIEPEPDLASMDFEGSAEGVAEAAAVAAEVAAEGESAEGEEGEGDLETEGLELTEQPRTVNVLFDLLLTFDGKEALPGITIDVAHSDPFQKEKARFQHWVETEGMTRGDARQISFEKEIPDYETGDQFAIEFRPFIPPEERANYREFSTAN